MTSASPPTLRTAAQLARVAGARCIGASRRRLTVGRRRVGRRRQPSTGRVRGRRSDESTGLSTAVRSNGRGADPPSPSARPHRPPLPPLRPATSRDASVARLRDAGELIVAIPVLIGFHPRGSLAARRHRWPVRSQARPHAPHRPAAAGKTPAGRMPARVEREAHRHAGASDGLLLGDPAGAAVAPAAGAAPIHPPRARRLVGHAAGPGSIVHTALWAEGTAAGRRWAATTRAAAPASFGPVGTAFAAAARAGRAGGARRPGGARAVRGTGRPGAHAPSRALLIRLRRCADPPSGCRRRCAAGRSASRSTPRLADAALGARAAGPSWLDDARVVALAGALRCRRSATPPSRRCTGSEAAAAEELWAALVRETPDPEAAEPAALLACRLVPRRRCAGQRRAGPGRARMARAPAHGILRSVAAAGIRPS